jgi:hypothetical protein
MADRTSAEIFAAIFEVLATELPEGEKRTQLADRFWAMSRNYDFSDYQMGCDDALIALGLAHRGPDLVYPDETRTFYGRTSQPSSKDQEKSK